MLLSSLAANREYKKFEQTFKAKILAQFLSYKNPASLRCWAVLESQKHNQLHFMTIVDLFFISVLSYPFSWNFRNFSFQSESIYCKALKRSRASAWQRWRVTRLIVLRV